MRIAAKQSWQSRSWRSGRRSTPRRHRGVVLIIALLVLVAMTMAGVALMRSVDTATLVSSNLAFRQSATASSDRGAELAFDYLRGLTGLALQADAPSAGYHASIPSPDVDFTGNGTASAADNLDWSGSGVKTVTGTDVAGNSVTYIIHRLCKSGTLALDPVSCTTWQDPSDPINDQGIVADVGTGRASGLVGTPTYLRGLYRVTVRITGPRNTYSYVQAIVVI
jgi:type IV pilus assembly protein PilX